jgi:hypothetical protein
MTNGNSISEGSKPVAMILGKGTPIGRRKLFQ